MPKLAFIFPGQGLQKFGMGKEIYDNFSVAKDILQNASENLKIDFKKLMFKENDKLNISEYTQPCIVLNSIMHLEVFKSEFDFDAEFFLGHSLGEFSALYASLGIKSDEVLKIVNLRGKFMQKACEGKDTTMMVVLGLKDEIVEEVCKKSRKEKKQVFVANYNCDGQIVIAGIKDHLLSIEKYLKDVGAKRTLLLNMSTTSHCPILQSGANELFTYLKDCDIKDKFYPVISNVTARAYNSKDEALELLKEQLIRPVLYKQSVKNYENDVDVFVEFGGDVLKGINKKITSKPTFSINSLNSLKDTIESLEKL